MIIYIHPEKLRALLTRVYKSDYSKFYSDLYQRHTKQDNPKNLEESFLDFETEHQWDNSYAESVLKKIPLLTRKDITSVHPNGRTYVDSSDIEFVSYTSGTSNGTPLVIQWSHVDNYYYDPSLGLDIKKPLILHPALNKNFGHTFIQQCRQATRPLSPVFADYQQLPQSAVLAAQTGVDSIYTTPTLAEHLHTYLEKKYDAKNIKLLVLFSETMTPTKKEVLSKLYPSAHIANVYASSEIGQILLFPTSKEIQSGFDKMHILKEAVVAVELINDELVITMDQNKAFPLIRYSTGDHFYYDASDDSLTWKGRDSIDSVKVNGMEVKIEDIEKALSYCTSDIGNIYQFHLYSHKNDTDNREQIKIVVETTIKHPTRFAQEEARDNIIKSLLQRWKLTSSATVQDAIHKGLVSSVEVSFVDALSFQSTKTRRLVTHF